MIDPRQTDPDHAEREANTDELGLLYISDVQALRRADSVTFQVLPDGAAYIDALLTTWAHLEPRIFTRTEQRLFPEISDTERRRRIRVGASIYCFGGDGRWRGSNLAAAVAFTMIHTAQLDEVWRSIAAFVRVGDLVTLHWRASNNNQYLIDAGLHRDELHIGIRRGRRCWTFLAKVETCADNTARMITTTGVRRAKS